MKIFVLFCVVISVLAEPPRFRPSRFRFQRQELAPTTPDSVTEPTTEPSGPYPPSGWKPAQPFSLPTETEAVPQDTYGAPAQIAPYPPSGWKPAQPFALPQEQPPPATSYGVPDNTYGPPSNLYGTPENVYGAPSTGAPEADPTGNPNAETLDGPVEVQKSMGEYYVLLPNGKLQKVEYSTKNDVQNMKYTARLQLRDAAPLYVYLV